MARARRPTNLHKTLERYGAAIVDNPEDYKGRWAAAFMPHAKEVRLDLGCGKGAFLTQVAAKNPDILFIGIDISDICVAHAAEKAVQQGLGNVRTVIADASDIDRFFAPEELSRIYLYFNSPFPKAKHAHLRLTYAPRLATYRTLVGQNGLIDLRTDNNPYWLYSLEQFRLAGYGILKRTEDLHAQPDAASIMRSEYDEKLVAKGAKVYALTANPGPAVKVLPQDVSQSLTDYLPADLSSLDYVPYGMEDTVANFMNRKRNAEKKAERGGKDPKIKTVAVLGAGAVGSYFLWGLADTLGDNLWAIASGERAERLRREGLQVNGAPLKLNIRTPREASGVDLLIVATKATALEKSLDDIALACGKNTLVLSVLNGVTSESIIGDRIGHDKVMPAFVKISSQRVGNSITFVPQKTPGIFYGEPDGRARSGRLWALHRLFHHSKVGFIPCRDIYVKQWTKFALNVSYNLPQAILNVGIGAYEDSEHVRFIQGKLAEEVIAIAAAEGYDIWEPAHNLKTAAASKAARFSTLQDLDAGRLTEVDLFAGDMVRMGRELGIATPYSEFCLHAIHALEERNAGKFDY